SLDSCGKQCIQRTMFLRFEASLSRLV
ncbi:hypothetical protein CP8484711_0751, partial [Chlamydia psittaci 84-8471/1]